jgi:hypothetical protein
MTPILLKVVLSSRSTIKTKQILKEVKKTQEGEGWERNTSTVSSSLDFFRLSLTLIVCLALVLSTQII